MSLFFCYHDLTTAVVGSDDRSCVERDGRIEPLRESVPKFSVLRAGDGRPLILAALGRNDLSTRLHVGTERLLRDQNIGLAETAKMLPFVLRPLFDRRPRCNFSILRDKLHVALVGFDPEEKRIRSFVWLSDDDFSLVETTADPRNVFFSLGMFEEGDEPDLVKFSQYVGSQGPRLGAAWVAGEFEQRMTSLSRKYKQIGPPSFFAALGPGGIVKLPTRFPIPTTQAASAIRSVATLTANRFYVGSIVTPAAGAPDTVGSGDGGCGAQGGVTTFIRPAIPSVTTVGNGSVSNAGYAVDGDQTSSCTLSVTGNGSLNQAEIVSGLVGSFQQRTSYLQVKVLFEIPTNSLVGANNPIVTVQISSLAGGVYNSATYNAGVTVGISNVTAVLPINANTALVSVVVQATTGAGGGPYASSGSLQVKVLDILVTAVQ